MKVAEFSKKIEFALHICMLFFLMNALVPLWQQMSGNPYDAVEGDPIQRGILLSGYVITLSTILIYPRKAFRLVRKSPLIWILILWAALSILWSGSPDITFRRVIGILLTTLYTLVLYIRYPFQSFLRLLGVAFLIAILFSLLMVIFIPEWGIMSSIHEGDWEGVFVNKNSLGKVSIFALFFFASLFSFSRNRNQLVLWACAIILGIITLVGSHSVTALVVFGTMILGVFLIRAGRSWGKAWPIFLMLTSVICGGVLILTIQNSEVLFDALGRDTSLTGRVPLWDVLIPMGLRQPLGFGYGAFWLGWEGPSAEVWSRLNWFLPNAHNGFLEIWLNLGWVGLALGIMLLGKIFFVNLPLALTGSKEAIFWLILCLIIITYNLVEVNFFNQNNIFWVMIAYAYISTQLRKPSSL